MARVYTETNEQILKQWDDGDCVSVIEMGGLGPGYEQCIQVVALELLRRLNQDPYAVKRRETGEKVEAEWKEFRDRMEEAVHEIDRSFDLGLSGAQAGAAINEASMWLCNGYAKAMNMAREQMGKEADDRFILVSRAWPNDKPVKDVAAAKN